MTRRLILRARLAVAALRWWLLPPVPVTVLPTRVIPPPRACAQCGRHADAGLCEFCQIVARWSAETPAAIPARDTDTWDGLYRPGRYPRQPRHPDESGLIPVVRSLVAEVLGTESRTEWLDNLFDPVIEQTRGAFAALAFKYRTEPGTA